MFQWSWRWYVFFQKRSFAKSLVYSNERLQTYKTVHLLYTNFSMYHKKIFTEANIRRNLNMYMYFHYTHNLFIIILLFKYQNIFYLKGKTRGKWVIHHSQHRKGKSYSDVIAYRPLLSSCRFQTHTQNDERIYFTRNCAKRTKKYMLIFLHTHMLFFFMACSQYTRRARV